MLRISSSTSATMSWVWFVVLLLASCYSVTYAKDRIVTVGAMFDTDDRDMQTALRDAVDRFKAERWFREDTKLDWTNVHMEPDISHQAAGRLCTLLKTGVGVVIGPQTSKSSTRVQSICNALQVPHIEMSEDFRMEKSDSSVNIAPHPAVLSKAYASLLEHWTWFDEFAVIYENVDDIFRIQHMLQFPNKKARLFQLEEGGDHRVLLKEILDKSLTRIVLAVRTDLILPLFAMAEDVGLTTEYYDYVIPNLDVHTLNFEKYYNRTMNITGFQLLDTSNTEFHDILHHWRRSAPNASPKELTALEQGIKTEVALLYDAIYLYARAISDIDVLGQHLDYLTPTCEYVDLIHHPPNYIIEKLKSMNVHGLTGPISFNEYGQRTDFTINIMKIFYVGEKGFRSIATWNEKTGFNQTLTESQLAAELEKSLENITLRVTTIFNNPFFMEIPEANRVPGGPIYEGYVVDLMDAVSSVSNITYKIHPVADKKYGAMTKDGTWNGMVGELINKKADLCAADLTITQVRQDAVDFTIPFMHLGISILYKKPDKGETSLFSFLKPLSEEVWIYMVTGYLGVSIVMFILARISPYEWDNPHPCNDEPEELENQFTLLNCLWFAIGSLMQQGCDFLPKAISTRMIAGIWWFFTLIMISSYTANLAAFLTAANSPSAINNAEDLARQTKIKYGTVIGGSTQNFFRTSQSEIYKKMWAFMDSSEPTVFAASNDEGVGRVKRGDYAFFMESTVIEYRVARECELMQIGTPLDSKGYGIATPKNSPHRAKINRGVLKLQDMGILLNLKRRWWEEKGLEKKCDEMAPEAMELGIANVGGVFVLLMGGMIGAVFIGAMEFLWNTRKNVLEKGLFFSELKKELKFALNFGISTKPIPKDNENELLPAEVEPQLPGFDRYPSTHF